MSPPRAVLLFVGVLATSRCGLPEYDFGPKNAAGSGVDAGDGSAGSAGSAGGVGGTGTGGSAGGGTGGVGGAAGAPASCLGDADCAATPSTPKCNLASGTCVPCLPTDDVCAAGQYCAPNGASFQCKAGCKIGGSDCLGALACDPVQHLCLGCTGDDDCAPGQICDTTTTACVPGCTPSHACQSGFDCCSGTCAALALDVDHCGACGNACPTPPNGKRVCKQAKCGVECTIPFTQDCNGAVADGCEVDVKTNDQHCGACGSACAAGQTCADGQCG